LGFLQKNLFLGTQRYFLNAGSAEEFQGGGLEMLAEVEKAFVQKNMDTQRQTARISCPATR
jgi:hypothetical protein